MAGDVYSRAPHAGRAGWSWYTGSAAWMYRAGLESMLGLTRRGPTFAIDPCIPSTWSGYELTWSHGATRFVITVTNPDGVCRGVASAAFDGAAADPRALPVLEDGGTHDVRIVLGRCG
jgi:cyclic beta-1,2-glucan synthetase